MIPKVNTKYVHCGTIAAVGVVTGTVPAFDVYDDVTMGKPLVTTLVENSPLTALSLLVVGVAAWLLRSDWRPAYTGTVARLSVATVVGVAGLVALVVFVQSELQNDLKPFIIAADAVVIGALAGVGLGVRTAQQQRATDDAVAQRDRFRALFENVPNPVVGVELVDGDPIVRAVNPTFVEVFGVDEADIRGGNLEEYIVPSDEPADPIKGTTVAEPESTEAWTREAIALETAEGRRQFIRVTAPVESGPERDGYAMYIDVTDQRQRRERLRVLSRTLRHDIRNSLGVIQPVATELKDSQNGQVERQAELIEGATEDILDVSDRTRRVEKQVAEGGDPRPRNLARIVTDVTDALEAEYGCDITVDAGGAGTDEEAFAAVTDGFPLALEEIVRNAVEHTDQSEPRVEVSVVPGPDEGYYDVRVADEGPGIPDTQVDVVTRETEQTQTEHALGLGLWTARWVLQNSGGELAFADTTPRGTVVTLRVPQADTTAEAKPEG